ncbi:rifamycin-inactivating phosphotransferase [Sporomusa acidovorans]|uniref:Prodigiosin synthesizing transferase PigC n=1 Tax=Sporomusa acidovorans (strain ATCC 49682 / DSM 3132 / Mol) TaxID=1123286 RepID=A0ABZ3J1L4_SPOA4|nr:rifamycin-inactivating phosphotransferase [Sporomusa acidovorans]OZC23187.1 phosphoenolpyruvate synthase [Sporomusa acidovorans DSM 3132]SDE97119.1 pyruvate, water dikinase [Sporomusa acidovorans]
MNPYVLYFSEINKSSLALVGGKGANLGELCRIPGVEVPAGFCITTQAYADFINTSEEFASLLESLRFIDTESLAEIKTIGERIRAHLESLDIPDPIEQEIVHAWKLTGNQHAYAVRSSATAEDLPGASFAGQQDTYLNIKGESELLAHVRKCWASLFTDRAITYRAKNGFDHRKVLLSVVVQQMVFPEVSGIMFTADPVTGNRKVVSIDAAFGLGEALVSGLVNADLYKVRADRIIKRQIAVKKLAIYPLADGDTVKREIPLEWQSEQALADEAILALARVGRLIEEHFGRPQDIEWGYAGGKIYIVQSRPITTLYPLPEVADNRPRVFVSFGHVQMMTDPIRPLGMSIWEKTMAVIDNQYSLVPAGGRLYLDITDSLASWLGRKTAPVMYSKSDALLSSAIAEVIRRRDFIATLRPRKQAAGAKSYTRKSMATIAGSTFEMLFREKIEAPDVSAIAGKVIGELRRDLTRLSGRERLDLIAGHFSKGFEVFMEGIGRPVFAAWMASMLIGWLARHWLGEPSPLDELTKSAPGNVSTEMGLELGDLADVIRPYPSALEYMKEADDAAFLDGLGRVEGGEAIRPAFTAFLAKYGMRCPGEIDITRPRWREKPTQLVPAIVSHIQSAEPGEHRLRFAQGKVEAEQAAQTLLLRLKRKMGGSFKSRLMGKLIRTYREFIGLREYPKYLMVSLLDEYKQAIMEEAARLVERGTVDRAEDVFYLTLEELTAAVTTGQADQGKIAALKEKYAEYEKLKPPRVLTSEGETLFGSYTPRELPAGALAGTPVSSGVVEGRARVITKLEEADLGKGDILVAPFTDPGWTPLFVSASGLVTEVGGLMTHGAVVAREYGIPAVVGVDDATHKIHDGQIIRVDGTQGFVEILE